MKFSPAIQYLRALAAMLVLCYHVVLHWIPDQKPSYVMLSGGVDIFFVISGFVMWGVTDGREGGAWDFFSKRLKRIVPLYWLMTTLMLLVLVVHPEATLTSRFDMRHVISSYLFIPAIHPVKGTFEPLLFPGWTLNYEMMFYLLFAAALFGPLRWRLALVIAPLALLVSLGLIPHEPTSLIQFYSNSLLLEFAMGCVLGALASRPALERPPLGLGLTALLLSPVLLVAASRAPDLPRGLAWGAPAVLFVGGWILLERARALPRLPMLQFLGDASYSIYLSHVIVLSATFQAVRHLARAHGAPGIVLASAFLILAATTGGCAVYWFIERRLIAWFKSPRVKAATSPAQ